VQSSDITRARLFLERAYDVLQGGDELSVRAREALGLLIEAFLTREHSRVTDAGNVTRFPERPKKANLSRLAAPTKPFAQGVLGDYLRAF
jgi:hypothetical protein